MLVYPNYSVQNKEQPWHVGLTVKSQSNNTNAQEIDCEYFIPYKNAVSAIKAVSFIFFLHFGDIHHSLFKLYFYNLNNEQNCSEK